MYKHRNAEVYAVDNEKKRAAYRRQRKELDQYLKKLQLKGRIHPATIVQLPDKHKKFIQHHKHIDMTKQTKLEEYTDKPGRTIYHQAPIYQQAPKYNATDYPQAPKYQQTTGTCPKVKTVKRKLELETMPTPTRMIALPRILQQTNLLKFYTHTVTSRTKRCKHRKTPTIKKRTKNRKTKRTGKTRKLNIWKWSKKERRDRCVVCDQGEEDGLLYMCWTCEQVAHEECDQSIDPDDEKQVWRCHICRQHKGRTEDGAYALNEKDERVEVVGTKKLWLKNDNGRNAGVRGITESIEEILKKIKGEIIRVLPDGLCGWRSVATEHKSIENRMQLKTRPTAANRRKPQNESW